MISGTDLDRFWPKVRKSRGCWNWTAASNSQGYGVFNLGAGRGLGYAHRISFTLVNGEIDPTKHLDHLCKNTRCVNPRHLEAVTPAENCRRSESASQLNRSKVFCKTGHPFTEENTRIRKDNGSRQCRKCERARSLRKKRRDSPLIVLGRKCVNCGGVFAWSSWRPEKIYCSKRCGDKVRMDRFLKKRKQNATR